MCDTPPTARDRVAAKLHEQWCIDMRKLFDASKRIPAPNPTPQYPYAQVVPPEWATGIAAGMATSYEDLDSISKADLLAKADELLAAVLR